MFKKKYFILLFLMIFTKLLSLDEGKLNIKEECAETNNFHLELKQFEQRNKTSLFINGKSMNQEEIRVLLAELEPKLKDFQNFNNLIIKETRNNFFLLLGRVAIGGLIRSSIQDSDGAIVVFGTALLCLPDLYNLVKSSFFSITYQRHIKRIEKKINKAKKALHYLNKNNEDQNNSVIT